MWEPSGRCAVAFALAVFGQVHDPPQWWLRSSIRGGLVGSGGRLTSPLGPGRPGCPFLSGTRHRCEGASPRDSLIDVGAQWTSLPHDAGCSHPEHGPADDVARLIVEAAVDIVDEAGCSRSQEPVSRRMRWDELDGVYTRFGSKDGAACAMFDRGFELLGASLRAPMQLGAPEADLVTFCHRNRRFGIDRPGIYATMFERVVSFGDGLTPEPAARMFGSLADRVAAVSLELLDSEAQRQPECERGAGMRSSILGAVRPRPRRIWSGDCCVLSPQNRQSRRPAARCGHAGAGTQSSHAWSHARRPRERRGGPPRSS